MQNRQFSTACLDEKAFSRADEREDGLFYMQDRFVSHLDTLALETVEQLIGGLIIEEQPAILDLMASWDSHIPPHLRPSRVSGLGMNLNELKRNHALTDFVIHNLNVESALPYTDCTFDAVINTVSVDYMTRPIEVFKDVGRILKPGGLFLVIFSNRMFPEKAVKVWRESSEDERVLLVQEFFREAGAFTDPSLFVSRGRLRPGNDKYASLGIPSDPIYALYAERTGKGVTRKPRPSPDLILEKRMTEEELDRKKQRIKDTLQCPYCNEKMKKWAVPDNPFEVTWSNEFMYICFNDDCPYYVRGWNHMLKTMNRTSSYRFMYNPEKDTCGPIPVPSPTALKESITD